MSKPTYPEIARRAGVGTATVERVLNGRGGVRPETAERVVMAARELDWAGRLPERHRGIVRIEVILVRPETQFFARLANAFRRIAAALDSLIQVQVTFLDEADPVGIAARINDRAQRRSGLVIVAPGHAKVVEALEAAAASGLPIVQLVNRNLTSADFVGIDNYAAGRTAGLMLSKLGAEDGSVLVLRHSLDHHGHRERVRGFSDYLSAHPRPGLEFRYVGFAEDDRLLGARHVQEAFQHWPHLTGVYNAGGGNMGILQALARAPRRIFFVGHELTETSRAALRDGVAHVILDQLPEAQARRAIDLMLWRIGLVDIEVTNPPIQFTTITSECV